MSRTASTMVDLGTTAPPFALEDVLTGHTVTLHALTAGAGGLLVMFLCPHCPYVKHVEAELGRLGADYRGRLAIAAINSNDLAEYPQDGPDHMRDPATRNAWTFPYLLAETQEIARAYSAACTPDFFLFDRDLKLAYRGQLDASRPRRGDYGNDLPVTGEDLRAAIDAVLAGQQPTADQRSSIGCNIKWKTVPIS